MRFRKKIPEAPKPIRSAPVLDMDWVNFNRRALRGKPKYSILEMHNMFMEFEEHDTNRNVSHKESHT